MIVPDHWAEARRQHKREGKQVTVRRYGWSEDSLADAQAMADARADEALRRILAGDKLDRIEKKVAYNGATGTPIREEVLARNGENVVTRNAYGAHCLNSPNTLFADIDFAPEGGFRRARLAFAVLSTLAVTAGISQHNWALGFGLLFAAAVLATPLAALTARLLVAACGGAERIARKRITRFIASNPAWSIRLYRTPAGYRVLATHQPFSAQSEETSRFFTAVSADPVYVRMCKNQNCFRARLTAKPWRIGLAGRMRPRRGVWPVPPESRAIREQWIAQYEARAGSFAACRYVESMGSGIIHLSVKSAVALHDRESQALASGIPIA